MDKVKIFIVLFSALVFFACNGAKTLGDEKLTSHGCDISTVETTIDCLCEMTTRYKKILVDRSDAEKPAEMEKFDKDVKRNIEDGMYTDEELKSEFEKRNGCGD